MHDPQRTRVLALIDSLTWGGAESLMVDLLIAAPAAGLELHIGYLREVDGSPTAVRLRTLGAQPRCVHAEPSLRPRSLRNVERLVAEVRPDIVHTHLDTADMLGGAACRRLDIPCVSTIHLIVRRARELLGEERLRDVVRRRLAAHARRHLIERVMCVSDAARASYLATGWDRPERVVTVRNGVARVPEPAEGRALRASLGIDGDELVVSMVGVLREGKGHAQAAAAAMSLLVSYPRLRLLVAGDG
ncbi:MAG: glycosyltransferase family 4 protein, partial [Solirubrobacteraceae bacterium]